MGGGDDWSWDGWLKDALCRSEGNPADWDDTLDCEPPESRSANSARHKRAIAVCNRCPVRQACAEHTDLRRDNGIRFGVHLDAWRREQTIQRNVIFGNTNNSERRTA